jgi:hypothetical protein
LSRFASLRFHIALVSEKLKKGESSEQLLFDQALEAFTRPDRYQQKEKGKNEKGKEEKAKQILAPTPTKRGPSAQSYQLDKPRLN